MRVKGVAFGGCGCLCIISDQTLPLISVRRKSSVFAAALKRKGKQSLYLVTQELNSSPSPSPPPPLSHPQAAEEKRLVSAPCDQHIPLL